METNYLMHHNFTINLDIQFNFIWSLISRAEEKLKKNAY